MEGVDHPYRRLIFQYWYQGALVELAGKEWTEGRHRRALDFDPHQSKIAHVPFLR